MSGCQQINCFVPPLLYPGPGNDEAWCIQSCCTCGTVRRRYGSRDYVEITPNVRKTFIRMLTSASSSQQVSPKDLPVYIEIRKRGCEAVVACYTAFQRTADGYLGFYWDSEFNEAEAGLYVGDVYIDCCYCFSVLFRIPRCSIVVDSFYNEMATESCGLGECSMLITIGEGVIGGIECEVVPAASECGLPAPYFETTDPVVQDAPENCNLACSPVFSIAGDDIVGSI